MNNNFRLSYLVLILIVVVGLITLFQIQLTELRDKNQELEFRLQRSQSQIKENESKTKRKNLDDNLVVIYNRVPKTGSTSFVGVAYDLCKKNQFHVLHINITSNMHVLSLPNQYKFVQNISNWNDMKPALYHGHMAFLDFTRKYMTSSVVATQYSTTCSHYNAEHLKTRLGAIQKPLYINIVRKPLDRLVSYYYFLRFGDNFRPTLIRRKHGDKMTFDECVRLNQPDCEPSNMWLQIPFFCGHSSECWKPGNRWALDKAKQNLLNNYLLVGITEQMEEFITLLEATLPRIFRGASEHYLKSNKSHLRQTVQKNTPNAATVSKIQKSIVWQMENELYEFAVQQFHFIKRKSLAGPGPGPGEKLQSYMYEKIRPK